MASTMHELGLHPISAAGTIIVTGLPTFSQEYVGLWIRSLLADASLHFDATGASDWMDYTDLIEILAEWCQNDDHHKKDMGHNTDLSASITDFGTVARNLRGYRLGDAEDPR
jgi:hypothetical protein